MGASKPLLSKVSRHSAARWIWKAPRGLSRAAINFSVMIWWRLWMADHESSQLAQYAANLPRVALRRPSPTMLNGSPRRQGLGRGVCRDIAKRLHRAVWRSAQSDTDERLRDCNWLSTFRKTATRAKCSASLSVLGSARGGSGGTQSSPGAVQPRTLRIPREPSGRSSPHFHATAVGSAKRASTVRCWHPEGSSPARFHN